MISADVKANKNNKNLTTKDLPSDCILYFFSKNYLQSLKYNVKDFG